MKLSIITINLNNATGLRRTIESVISQTFTDFEYIIIDGASTDSSVDVIKEFADKITYWVSEPDKGIYNGMNKGILKAHGEYLLFLNSGDWFYSDSTLEKVFELNRSEDILYGDIISFTNENEQIPDIYPDSITGLRLFETTICHQSIFHKRSLFENQTYNEKLKVVSDWEFLLKSIVVKNCSTYKIDQFIVYLERIPNESWGDLCNSERQSVLKDLLPQRIIQDYSTFLEFKNHPLFPYLMFFSKDSKRQRNIKRLMKIYMFIIGQRKFIPK